MPRNPKRWKEAEAKNKVIRDLVLAQFAPVAGGDAIKLFQEIKAEVLRLGLPEKDANWFWNKMQRDQWFFQGFKVTNAIATVQNWHEHKFFPSQRV
jgi:hypothetical protein